MKPFPGRNVSDQADWTELALIVTGGQRLGRSQLAAQIGESAPELDDAETEVAVGEVLTELKRRARIGGDYYPFEVDRTAVVRRNVDDRIEALYSFLALNSADPGFRQPVAGFSSGRVFEEIVELALVEWTRGTATVFARVPAGESTGVRAAIERLGRALQVESYPSKALAIRKDHGLDVAAWRPFPDRRSGHPVLLCQCTVGWGLTRKAREVSAADWNMLLDIRQDAFSAALAIPHVLPPDYQYWRQLRRATDLILDRMRLLRLLEVTAEPWLPLANHGPALATGLEAWADA